MPLTQTIVPNNRAYFQGMCEDLGIKLERCNGNQDAPFDDNGRCKVCTLPVNCHRTPARFGTIK